MLEARAAGAFGGFGAVAGVDVYVGAVLVVEAGVGEGGEGRDADADETGGDLGGAPEEDLGLVVGYVGAFARFDADDEADDAEGGGAGRWLDGWGLCGWLSGVSSVGKSPLGGMSVGLLTGSQR